MAGCFNSPELYEYNVVKDIPRLKGFLGMAYHACHFAV